MRIVQVGFGNIGREVFADWAPLFDTYMVTDLIHQVPTEHEWDGERVDVAIILVDTPKLPDRYGDGFDYTALSRAIEEYAPVADFILVRSTVSLGFLKHQTYRTHQDKIGFSPEFYGATKWSSRDVLTMDFIVLSDNVPQSFTEKLWDLNDIVQGASEEIIVAKLTENAFLATKVTFFHDLAVMCESNGVNFEKVRRIATLDPRIGPDHSYMEEPGWQSHCFDKDVPAYAQLGSNLIPAVIEENRALLFRRGRTTGRSV